MQDAGSHALLCTACYAPLPILGEASQPDVPERSTQAGAVDEIGQVLSCSASLGQISDNGSLESGPQRPTDTRLLTLSILEVRQVRRQPVDVGGQDLHSALLGGPPSRSEHPSAELMDGLAGHEVHEGIALRLGASEVRAQRTTTITLRCATSAPR